MRKHLYRTLTIYVVLLIACLYVYPTIGWMLLSPESRQARLDRWEQEDKNPVERGYFAENAHRIKRWLECDRELVINLGLDLQGGVEMVVGIDYDKMDAAAKKRYTDLGMDDASILKDLQQQVKQRIERRTNEFGTKEPIIQTMGDRQIQVQLPGEKDVQRAKDLILRTAYLSFHIVEGPDKSTEVLRKIDGHFKGDFVKRLQRPAPNKGWVVEVPMDQIEGVRDMVKEAEGVEGLIPADQMVAFSRAPRPNEPQYYMLYVLKKESVMTGDGLTMAAARPDEQKGGAQWQILFGLNAESGRLFGDRTEQNVGQLMAIVVDGVVESAPQINDRITTSGNITGKFDQEEARDLAIALNSGSLPVPVLEEQTGIVGPSLGEDSIRKGVWSCVIGILVVLVFMTFYYHLVGVIACVALIANALLILAAMAYMGATLTLPGIAGLILTLGMAVDANVLIYERIREEKRLGKSLLAMVEGGYEHAFPAIIDGHVTTIISGLVLLQFGSGPIQGFAVTLTIGIIASLFTSLTITHAIFDFLTAKKWLTKITMLQAIKPDTKIPFLEYRNYITFTTAGLVVLGLAYFGFRGDKMYGVEFTTGTNVILNIASDQEITNGSIREVLESKGFEEPTVTAYEQVDQQSKNRYMIHVGEVEKHSTTGTTETAEASVSDRVRDSLKSLAGDDVNKIEIEKVDMVGPAVGAQLKWDALQAIIWAVVFIIIYLWFRFELKFSIGAIVALLHDVGITLGLFALSGRQISLGVVAAILTIIGYSLNDTIIVFDRLRSDLRLFRGRGMSLLEIMDKAINETLSRTILTSMLTFFVVVVLFFFGGKAIEDFAFALAVGILVGTYSSIYIASPIVFWWQKYLEKSSKGTDGGEAAGPSSRRRRRTPRNGDKDNLEKEVTV